MSCAKPQMAIADTRTGATTDPTGSCQPGTDVARTTTASATTPVATQPQGRGSRTSDTTTT